MNEDQVSKFLSMKSGAVVLWAVDVAATNLGDIVHGFRASTGVGKARAGLAVVSLLCAMSVIILGAVLVFLCEPEEVKGQPGVRQFNRTHKALNTSMIMVAFVAVGINSALSVVRSGAP